MILSKLLSAASSKVESRLKATLSRVLESWRDTSQYLLTEVELFFNAEMLLEKLATICVNDVCVCI